MALCKEKLPQEKVKESEKKETGSGSNPKAVCGVCKRLFKDPKLLSCLHTFCADCIRQLEPFSPGRTRNGVSSAPEQLSLTVLCPECDTEVELPASGVDGLTTDHLALDEVFMETLLIEKSVLCDLCADAEADRRCDVCSFNLCDFCSQAHRRQKRTSSHAVRSIEELKHQGRLTRRVLCSLHSGQELRLFCEPCDLSVCLECAATFHKDHRCVAMHDVIHIQGDRIRKLVSGGLQTRMAHLEDALRCVETSEEALQAQAASLAGEIRAFAQAYASAMEAHCRSLLHALESMRLQRRNQLHLQRAQLQQALCDIRGSVDFAERLLTCGSEAEILNAKGVTLRRLMSLLESGYDPNLTVVSSDTGSSVCFLAQESAGQVEGFPMVGVLHAKTVEPNKCTIQGEGDALPAKKASRRLKPEKCFQQVVEGRRSEFTLVCRDAAGKQMVKGGDPVLVSIINTDKKGCKIKASVVDNNDGSYAVSYTPTEPGSYSVWVCVKAQHVKGSPFGLIVKKKMQRHHGIFHCCSFCSSGGAKEARCGCTGTMPGGFQGCGHGHKGHPGKPHWSCCGIVVERSECVLSLGAGSHRGHVRTVEL